MNWLLVALVALGWVAIEALWYLQDDAAKKEEATRRFRQYLNDEARRRYPEVYTNIPPGEV